jgi:hypothetical protein
MTEQTHGTPPFLMRCLSADEWQAYVASYDFGTIPPSRIVMHHTWKPTLADWQGEASMRGMQSYYASLGWSAAPHLYVAPDGIWLATPMREVGVHAGIGNSGWWHGTWSYSIGVEMVGNYDRQRPSGDVWRLTKDVLGGLAKRLDRAPQELIFFHRDFADKTCPGRAVPKTWVWTEVETWLEAQQPPVQEPQVHEAFRTAWEASGGIWQPEQLMPGYPIAPAEVGADGRLQQRFERGIAVQIKGITHWRLISEVFADYAASNAPEPVNSTPSYPCKAQSNRKTSTERHCPAGNDVYR